MSEGTNSVALVGTGLNSISISGCSPWGPKLSYQGKQPVCRVLVCDGQTLRRSKFVIEAVATDDLALFLADRVVAEGRVALSGSLVSKRKEVAGGFLLDYELAVSHVDAGEALRGRCVERNGLNAYTISGVVTKEPVVSGLPGRDSCRFWMCDGDSEEESSVVLPVRIGRGRVSELMAEVRVGDRLAVGGYVRCRREWVSGREMNEYEMEGCYVDGGFLVDEGA